MRLGVVFPQTEIGNDVAVIREFATSVESAGYQHIVAYDHVLGHQPDDLRRWREVGPYTNEHSFHEVFVLFAFLAAITTKVELVSEVLVLPQRQTALVAKQAAEIQLLSGGRLRLGVGLGWNAEEYRALGKDFHNRGRRVTEQIKVMRRLWSEDVLTIESHDHSILSSGINPRPATPIPVWMGGSAPIAVRRAAAIADGFMLDDEMAQAPPVLELLSAELAANGRDTSAFGLAGRLQLDAGDLGGSLGKAAAWRALGLTHLSVITMDSGLAGPRDHSRVAQDFMRLWRESGFD